MASMKKFNTWLSILLELAMLAAFGYWGFRTGGSLGLKLLLGIGVPLVAFVLWGLLLSPAGGGQRISSTVGVIVSVGLFYLAVLALYQAKQPVLATAMLVAVSLNRALAVVWKQ